MPRRKFYANLQSRTAFERFRAAPCEACGGRVAEYGVHYPAAMSASPPYKDPRRAPASCRARDEITGGWCPTCRKFF